MYLGDGYIASHARNVFRLDITCCDEYPGIMAECAAAISMVMPRNKVGWNPAEGCTHVNSYSKHWPCLFPQHGPGHKHERVIQLADWQRTIVDQFGPAFIRGLIHSDGTRCINRVTVKGKAYAYPRYFFSNRSKDILGIFGDACDALGIDWRYNLPWSISIAKRASVARLDEFVGPKF
ncbi:MAG: helix-turn-helix domain-containing protein [Actinobacteria bacterium]|nr:helix-turn-helix domain-containing protein [Actinomycetota bacterium]MBV9664214.1 helix-turn-helix domain-containing protein [Actinomycetota bacterium]